MGRTSKNREFLDRGGFHGEWNYAVLPPARAAPEPDPGPGRPARPGPRRRPEPPRDDGLRAEDLTALAQALEVPFEARLQQRNYTLRRGPRVNAVPPPAAPTPTAAWASPTTCSPCASATTSTSLSRPSPHYSAPTPAPSATPPPWPPASGRRPYHPPAARPPATSPHPRRAPGPRRPGGIPLTIPENGQTMPDHFRTRQKTSHPDTPETTN